MSLPYREKLIELSHAMAEDYTALAEKWIFMTKDPLALQMMVSAMAVNQSSLVQIALIHGVTEKITKAHADWCLDVYRESFQTYVDSAYCTFAKRIQALEQTG